jgi:hypothetical protein
VTVPLRCLAPDRVLSSPPRFDRAGLLKFAAPTIEA